MIIAAALVYHGRQLAEVFRRLEAMEVRTGALDSRLEEFSSELPELVGQAGNNAGRQAVHGAVQEIVQIPFNLKHTLAPGAQNPASNALTPSGSRDSSADPDTSWIRFEIRKPVVNIDILPNLKEVPAIPWLPLEEIMQQPAPESNHARNSLNEPESSAERK